MWSARETEWVRGAAPSAGRLRLDVHLRPGDLARGLRAEVAQGLGGRPRELSPKWFYDEEGSRLFDAITRLPEYYPTRAERSILAMQAGEIARLSGADTLVELGSGTSEKTRLLLDAFHARRQLVRFVPFDVCAGTLVTAARAVALRYPRLQVHGVVGDFERHLDRLPVAGRRMVAFLGGTIGNLKPSARRAFLTALASNLLPGDSLLLGTDLVKDRRRLLDAYDDAAEVTAAFNRNVLVRINRELGADFRPERFAHVVRFDEEESWIEMRLRAQERQVVRVPRLELLLTFDEAEEMRTEVSTKFHPEQVEAELHTAGFALRRFWTDAPGDFGLSLAVRGRR
ncbi:MAG: L-histidine N(alpha)-methyltransferase [Myxococcaceae bacterium]|nr:L-histidine N(alpha)-methyltransferase [Myxococcaceae bacterium]